ncbi:MAG: undecaprenyl-phosphate galactose phosphotransferase WbaP [Pirellulales bacterium]
MIRSKAAVTDSVETENRGEETQQKSTDTTSLSPNSHRDTTSTATQVRRDHANNLIKSRSPLRMRSQTGTAAPNMKGNRAYLGQLILTCTPLLAADLIALLAAVLACDLVGLTWLNPEDSTSLAMVWLPTVILSMVLINAVLSLYPGVRLGTVDEIKRLTISLSIVGLIIASRLRPDSPLYLSRVLFLICAYGLILFLAPFLRSRTRRWMARTSWWGFPTMVCGDNATVFGVYQWLSDNRRLGLRPVGVVTDPDTLEIGNDTPWQVTSWKNANHVAAKENAYWSVLVEEAEAVHDVTSTIENYLGNIPHVLVVSELTGIPDHWDRHQMDESLTGFLVEQHLLLPVQQLIKRGMDLVISTLACLVLVPLFAILAVLIKLTSPGPIFYGHERIGKGNTRFKAWKFRTMVSGADKMIEEYLSAHPELREEWDRDHKLKDDPRVTGLGHFMRKWSIDELPQIWNVFCGEMSVVGPRPIVEAEIVKYHEHFNTFCSVLPGITGMWQVCGRNDTTYEERVMLDVYYIHHWSPWLDLYLLAKTVKTVLFTKGAY